MPQQRSTSAPTEGDAEIVRLLREREGGGLRLLLVTHGSRTRTALKKRFAGQLSEAEIDEALNIATYNAWRKVHTFDASRGSLRAWFFVIAHNAGYEIVRERQRRRDREVRGFDLDRLESPVVLTPVPPRAFLDTLRECIDALPRLQRRIIEADLQSGDTADAAELAKVLHTTKNSVYVSRSAARKALRRALGERGCTPGEGTGQLQWK